MTVTPHGLNDDTTSVSLVSETSVSVAATGAIFSSSMVGTDRLVVTVHGDIDVRSAPILTDYVCARVGESKGVRLVLDLSDVDFFGISGLDVFTELDSAVESAGSTWCLVEGHPVSRLLQAAAVVPMVRRFKTVAEGLK